MNNNGKASAFLNILSVTVISDVIPCLGGYPVKEPNTPNWTQELAKPKTHPAINDGQGSKRPGVFVLTTPITENTDDAPNKRTIQDEIIKENISKSETDEVIEIFKIARERKNPKSKYYYDKFSTLELEVEVKKKYEQNVKSSILIGKLGPIIFFGSMEAIDPTIQSPQKIKVTPLIEPHSFTRIWGDMTWSVVTYEPNVQIQFQYLENQNTRLELFWIINYPSSIYKKGVWTEVLRILHRECHGLKYLGDIIHRVVNYCHSGTGLRYDCYTFSRYYVEHFYGGAFNLSAYLAQTYPFVNCYDQTAAVQTFLSALGIKVNWGYIRPFGFLNETHLVGRGQCNNPGFAAESASELLPANDPQRIPFGNHSFCIRQGRDDSPCILDATTGPHFGYSITNSFTSGGEQTYLNLSIDGLTNLYGSSTITQKPGRLDDINTDYRGVTDIQSVTSTELDLYVQLSLQQQEKVQEFKDLINYDQLAPVSEEDALVIHWAEPEVFQNLKTIRGVRLFESSRIGININVKQWSLIWADSSINIELFVATRFESAREHFIIEALSSNHPHTHFKMNKQFEELGYLSVVANYPYYSVNLWCYHNVFVKLTTYNPPIERETLIARIEEKVVNEKFKIKSSRNFTDSLPSIINVTLLDAEGKPFSGILRVGQTVTLKIIAKMGAAWGTERIHTDNALELEFFPEGESLIFEKEESETQEKTSSSQTTFSITFSGRTPGCTTIQFVISDSYTMLNSNPWKFMLNVIKNDSEIPDKLPLGAK